MYSDIYVEVNTARDTRLTWGTSYQPAIQDMMQVIENFTKPQIDPSEKVGFWDKIRLSFHSRVSVAWTGGGDVQLMLKGSRDPYTVTGHGAGFVMVWRNNVRWCLWKEDDPQKFMTVDSGDFVLAIPDFSRYARNYMATHRPKSSVGSSVEGHRDGQMFKKVIMKVSGKVRWLAGLVFERNLDDGKRTVEFEPHYKVTLKNPVYVKDSERGTYDAFRGFRSNHIHLSIAVSAPTDRDWKSHSPEASSNYNAVHLTPRFFTHFFAWWAMFSGVMSLPIRQGALFPNVDKSGKKFGRHIATIKFSLLLSPLYVSHIYKHKEPEEIAEDAVSSTGLKIHLDSFMLDLHMRREEFRSEVKGMSKTVKTSGMRINETLLDLIGADLRAISAGFSTTSAEAVREATTERLQNYHDQPRYVDVSKFQIPDGNYDWVDADDFVEVDWILPSKDPPETLILPLAYSPRFTYRRQTDHGDTISGDINRQSPFGNEDTHNCIFPTQRNSREVQGVSYSRKT